MYLVFALLSLSLLSACSVELQDQKSHEVIQSSAESRFPMSGPYHEIVVGPNPNEYSVRLSPPPGTIKIEKQERGSVFAYRFVGAETTELAVPIPKDLVITGNLDLPTSLNEYRRLFFAENSFAITHGADLKIEVEEIIAAPNSGIISFQKSADEGQMGKSGGRLHLITNSIQGSLVLQLHGQSGGPGKSGTPYLNRAATGETPESLTFWPYTYNCRTNKAGGRGADGAPGQDGLPGAAGGEGGSILLQVPESFRANFTLRVPGGTGGVGGKGGSGQAGGLPGTSQSFPRYLGEDALRRPILEPCPEVPNLGEGNAGVSGRDGSVGNAGKEGTISFR